MKKKVDIINGAIGQIFILKKGGIIELRGLHNITISAPKEMDLDKRLLELYVERENLQIRINRMKPINPQKPWKQ